MDRPKEAKADRRPVQTVLKTNNQTPSRCHIQARKQPYLAGKEGQVRWPWAFLSFDCQP